MQAQSSQIWRSPEEIVEIAFRRSSVVMMNEAHDGDKRCIRTRQIGKRILPVAHQAGVRHLSMEALRPNFAEQCNSTRRVPDEKMGYLSQPEMREFIQTALDLSWTLIPYEADSFKWLVAQYGINVSNSHDTKAILDSLQQHQSDLISMEYTNWREEQQARNLNEALQSLPVDTPMLVWCGNDHHSKKVVQDWTPMGNHFQKLSGINHFVIDQIRTVRFDTSGSEFGSELIEQFAEDLVRYGGMAGFLVEEAPSIFGDNHIADAYLLSIHNELE
jgi:hypothetical protein